MGYFEKLFMGNAFPMEEIQDALMASERGKELNRIVCQTSDTQDTLMERLQVEAFKLGFSYGVGFMQEIESHYNDPETE